MLKSFFTAATLALTTIAFCSQASAGELADLIEANTEIGEQADTLNKRQQRMLAYQQRMVHFAQQREQLYQQAQRRAMIQQNILQQAQAMPSGHMIMQQQIYAAQMSAMAQLAQRQRLRQQAVPTGGVFTPIHENDDPYTDSPSQNPFACGNSPVYGNRLGHSNRPVNGNRPMQTPGNVHVSGYVN